MIADTKRTNQKNLGCSGRETNKKCHIAYMLANNTRMKKTSECSFFRLLFYVSLYLPVDWAAQGFLLLFSLKD